MYGRSGGGDDASRVVWPELVPRFRLLTVLGTGAVGTVWRARDLQSGQTVALKLVPTRSGAHRRRARALRREADLQVRLRHPRIPRVFAFGVCAEGGWCSMAYLSGGTLGERIAREGPLALRETAACALQVLEALEFLHRSGVVHRDVKPSNVLFDGLGEVFLGDLGLARVAPHVDAPALSSDVVGTPAFMAPEQRTRPHDVGPAADLYALAMTMFSALAGVTTGAAELYQARSEPWVGLPEAVRAVLDRALQVDPEDRYASAADMAEAIRDLFA